MKKRMLSLAAMFAALSFASPAHAELKIGGDASTRIRAEWKAVSNADDNRDDLKFQYRVRLKASADLGNGYFFKTLIANEDVSGTPGWATVASNNSEHFQFEVSNFIIGRMMPESHYMVGRLPLNSFNNPIFDVALYPVPTSFTPTGIYAVDVPVFQWNFDRIYAMNYGTKIGNGEFNATFVVLDNHSTTQDTPLTSDGFFNDGYAAHLWYKTTIGDVTFEPQALIVLTDAYGGTYQRVSPNTFGAQLTIPVSKSKIGLSGYYTVCKDSKGATGATKPSDGTLANVDYSGYILRAKAESGPFMAWVDYQRTADKSTGSGVTNWSHDAVYQNVFVWAQYKIGITESALGSFSVTPTLRYRKSWGDNVGVKHGTQDNELIRGELWATVTF
ncbi:MAG: hypothetical protein HGB36_07535 [Chlorobiaceae bacterium]|nr:hypothetical protein [Chlorobiaceae bacterium]